MRYSLSFIFLLSFSLGLKSQSQSFSNLIEIIPENHTRIATCRPAQIFVKNSQNFVIDLAGATGYNKTMPHISSTRALVQIRDGKVLSPQLNVFRRPRDYYQCVVTVNPVQAFTDNTFLQIRSYCNKVDFSRFFMDQATNSYFPVAHQSLELEGLNIIHNKLMIHENEAYALLVRTPELKPDGSVNYRGVASDSAMLVKLNFDQVTYDTISFLRLPIEAFQSFYKVSGEVRLDSAFSRLDLVINDSILIYSLGTFEPEIRFTPNFYNNSTQNFVYQYVNDLSPDSIYYQGVTVVNYIYDEGHPYLDSTYIKFPPQQFKYRDGFSIHKLNNSQLLLTHSPLKDGDYLGLRLLKTDYLGNIKWSKQMMPDDYKLFLSKVVELEDTLIIAGGYYPGRFIVRSDSNRREFINYGYINPVAFRLLADGTNLDANPDLSTPALEVFPNPFQVDFKFAQAGATKYQLLSVNGDLVAEEELNPEFGVYRIYQPALNFGLYILRVYDIYGQVIESKLFKLD